MYERSIGIGVMGYHSYLQRKHIPFESPMAVGINKQAFKFIRETIDEYQASLPKSARCPISKELGTHRRNITTMAVAPTMSISSLCNVTSSGIEPIITNSYTKKVKQGSFPIKNKYLGRAVNDYYDKEIYDKALPHTTVPEKQYWIDGQWASIQKHEGSVQHLEWMDDYTKDVFKTAFEIDQRHVIQQASDRQEFIDQGQSVNLFIPANSNVQTISDLHILAWKKNLKSLYYLRSTAGSRASTSSDGRKKIETKEADLLSDSCPSCC